MRLKLILSTSLCTALAALVTSCSNNSSVVDDWPGIDEMTLVNEAGSQALTSGDSFTLKSKLKLPKMGKDVDYVLTTTCLRSDKEASDPMRLYKKIIESAKLEKELASEVSVAEVLPDETVIFPEFFSSCEFSIFAKNSIGSTQTRALKRRGFSYSEEDRELLVYIGSEVNHTERVIPKDSLSKLEIKLENQGNFDSPRLICFSNSLTTEKKIGIPNDTTRVILGSNIEIPGPKTEALVENCITIGKDTKGNTLTSKRFKLLNNAYSKPQIQFVHSTEHLNGHEQIFYENSNDLGLKILEVEFSSEATHAQKYIFKNPLSVDNTLHPIVGMNDLTDDEDRSRHGNSTYEMLTKPTFYKAQWFRLNENKEALAFTVKKDKIERFSLSAEFGFNCFFPDSIGALSSEIGVVVALARASKVFELDMIEENDFTTDLIETFNILESAAGNNLITVSNHPTSSNLELQSGIHLMNLIFRNNKIAPGEHLLMVHRAPPTNPIDDIDTMTFNTPIKNYPFTESWNVEGVTCESTLEEIN